MEKLSFKGIDKRISIDRAERNKLQEEITKLLQESSDIGEKMQAAANDGDLELFKTMKEKRDEVENAVFVAKSKLAAPRSHEIREAVCDRWDRYAEAYNKDFAGKYEAYKVHRKELCAEFMELVEMQRNALRDKDSFNAFVGQNEIDQTGWTARELEYLDKNPPEIEFLTKTERPDIEVGLREVINGRRDISDMTGNDLDPRIVAFMKHGRVL